MDEQQNVAPPASQAVSPAQASTAAPAAPATGHLEQNTLMAALSYISVLVLIPFLTAKDDPFVMYHARQGLVLFIIEVIGYVLVGSFIFSFWFLWQFVNLACIILAIIGIMHAVQGKEEPLPFVGQFASMIKF